MLTLDQVIDNAIQLPPEQQGMLIDILYKRQVEMRRNEIAKDAKRSIMDFHKGKIKPQPLSKILEELHEAIEEQEDNL